MSGDPKQKPSRLGRGLSALIGEVEGASSYESRDPEAKTDASTIAISDTAKAFSMPVFLGMTFIVPLPLCALLLPTLRSA